MKVTKEFELKEQAKQCYIEMFRALTAKDAVALAEVLADDFILVHVNGSKSSKEEYVRDIADGSVIFHSAEHQSIEVNTDGDRATLTGKSRTDVTNSGGERRTWHLQQDLDLVYNSGKWLITEARASTY